METTAGKQIDRPVRYAVVGLGHIAQVAVLPAFRRAKENARLTALVSGDPEKRRALKRKCRGVRVFDYGQYEECLRDPDVDAVYLALPKHLHCGYAVRAAEAGKHVLCEKPMAVTEDECHKMIEAADSSGTLLMIAYRLHFEAANLQAIERARAGELGELRYFNSSCSMQVREKNVRLRDDLGGGPLYDIGIDCINAARSLFGDEPTEVFAARASSGDLRFNDVDEMFAATLRFPKERLASFTCNFGAADVSSYRLVGTKGDLRVEPAFEYAQKSSYQLTVDGKKKRQTFAKRDQFAAELLYFSECVRAGTRPEPSGVEGLADVRIIEALLRSAKERRAVSLQPVCKDEHPSAGQEIHRPPVETPELAHVESASKE